MTHLVVVGGGLAGLTAAIAAAEAGVDVTLLDDAACAASASVQAQGGFSAVTAAGVAAGDSVGSHVADTLEAGALHGDAAVVAAICSAAADHVATLTRWGTVWDAAPDGSVALTREAAHAAARIAHCGGDATGAGIIQAVLRHALRLEDEGRLELRGDQRGAGLLVQAGAATGVLLPDGARIRADAVVLASGGISGVYATRTSRHPNPADAAAMAWRAGAVLADAEMVQFHPTYSAEAGFMLTEALRGEGAVLRDADGQRFMLALDERAELAPRDVVARGVAAAQGGAWLDAAPIVERRGPGFLARRFPTVTAALERAGLDLERGPVAVRPAQHYWMGGVAVDQHARSTVPGLLVVGEASRTGLHGANRLASNSLLEAVHTGLAAVATVGSGRHLEAGSLALADPLPVELDEGCGAPLQAVRTIADARLGVDRDEAGLRVALRELERPGQSEAPGNARASSESIAARLVATAALYREGSLGAHHRVDTAGTDRGGARPGSTITLINPHPTAQNDLHGGSQNGGQHSTGRNSIHQTHTKEVAR
ncbi:FAD-binding protein [Galactobacter caseinivorans]|uniref:L-aspartate oxidase n=1 Tax=Galactobacter caseinivorans TaxID=2676123 RepID=A0A496PJE8_9MICC|nr:FAD-binding protein [Galactobacter caseinivorans]RKW70615.1 FAD-binding protein [Galactobacter caseinivorans]